jgi:hypothetical protein
MLLLPFVGSDEVLTFSGVFTVGRAWATVIAARQRISQNQTNEHEDEHRKHYNNEQHSNLVHCFSRPTGSPLVPPLPAIADFQMPSTVLKTYFI